MASLRVFLTLASSLVVAFASGATLPPKASRAEKDGWIIIRLQGTPKEIGFEHGELLAPEIRDTLTTLKADLLVRSGKEWSWYRQNAHRLFWPKLDQEYKDEITAIAEGARSKGDDIDTDDVLAMNGHVELWAYYLPLSQRTTALGLGSSAFGVGPSAFGLGLADGTFSPMSMPTGDGGQASWARGQTEPVSLAPNACSAFVATGAETADGKIVMGQNFWWDYVTGERWNIIFDITPEHGNRVLMDGLPGLIMSGTDWAINSAGLALTETTIGDFVGFNDKGTPEFERMRKAIQYSNSLSDLCDNLEKDNNGAYANTWLMADTKSNEIGKLELGLKNVTFVHTNDGYYYGANFPENPKLIAEEAPGYVNDPEAPRKHRWQQDLTANKGKVDVSLAKTFIGDSYDERNNTNDGMGGALCGKSPDWGAVSGRVLTTDMVKHMEFWARMGIPDGSTISAAKLEAADPQLRGAGAHDMPSYPWTVIQ